MPRGRLPTVTETLANCKNDVLLALALKISDLETRFPLTRCWYRKDVHSMVWAQKLRFVLHSHELAGRMDQLSTTVPKRLAINQPT